MKTNTTTKSTNLHTRPLPAHNMSDEQIEADPTRVQWRTAKAFSASRAQSAVIPAHQVFTTEE